MGKGGDVMKKGSKTLITLVVILGMLSGNICFAEAGLQDGITWFFSTYKYDLPATMIELIDNTFTPVVLPCGDVFVKLDKVLYDGIWMYTSAVIAPTEPEKSLVMPDDAEPWYPTSGTYGENLRSDSRTFAEVAIEEKKQLIRVMAVPQEFYEMTYFICGSRQDANDTSTMVCATPCNWQEDEVDILFHIVVTIIDPVSNESISTETYDYPLTIRRLGDFEVKEYRAVNVKQTFEYETIKLIKTALTSYAFAERDGDRIFAPLQVCDEFGAPIATGVPSDSMTTLNLCTLPTTLFVRTEQNQFIMFSTATEESRP